MDIYFLWLDQTKKKKEHVMKPIIPFEPISTDDIPEGPNWIGQVKWDGVRVLTYLDHQGIRLFNRKQNERTYHYPELTNPSEYCSAHSMILDGEIIALKNGKPSFYEVMRRDGIRNLSKVEHARKQVPINYMVFDLLYLEGEWITSNPLEKRQELLRRIITPNQTVQLVENTQDNKAIFQVVMAHELEGVVYKDLSSTYLINGKDGSWRKKKFYRDLNAVIGGVTIKNDVVNAVLLGLYDKEGHLWYIGHAGTGKLTQKDWRDLTKGIYPLIQADMPFSNTPPRYKQTIWLKPVITMKVQFAEWAPGHSLRQPSIQAILDVPAQECVLE
jgi:bifunctional non-homologous end joining protein LigD